jgi:hypothetical protein
METNRRSFLKGLGILGAAPAIVKAENIMRIWTPPKDIILPSQSIQFKVPEGQPGYYTLSFHINDGDKWVQHSQQFFSDGKTKTINFPFQFKRVPSLSVTGVQMEYNPRYERPVIVSNLPVSKYIV